MFSPDARQFAAPLNLLFDPETSFFRKDSSSIRDQGHQQFFAWIDSLIETSKAGKVLTKEDFLTIDGASLDDFLRDNLGLPEPVIIYIEDSLMDDELIKDPTLGLIKIRQKFKESLIPALGSWTS